MARFNRLVRIVIDFSLSTLLLFSLNVGAATTKFIASVSDGVGSCDISVPETVIFNNGNPITPTDIEKMYLPTVSKVVKLGFSNCSGSGLLPRINVTGSTQQIGGRQLFVNSDATSVGYGMDIKTSETKYFLGMSSLAQTKMILTNNWATSSNLSLLNGATIPMTAIVSCGTCDAARNGGDLDVTVMFNFVYY